MQPAAAGFVLRSTWWTAAAAAAGFAFRSIPSPAMAEEAEEVEEAEELGQ